MNKNYHMIQQFHFWVFIKTKQNKSKNKQTNKKTLTRKDICTAMFITALFRIAKIWKKPKCPSMDEWLKEMWYHTHTCTHTHTQNGLLLNHHKKERNLAIINDMDGPWGHYAKWNKSDRETQLPYDLSYMWNLKIKNPSS